MEGDRGDSKGAEPGARKVRAKRATAAKTAPQEKLTGAVRTLSRAEALQRMYVEWQRGLDYPTIAGRMKARGFDISARTVRRNIEEMRAHNFVFPETAPPHEGIRKLDELIDQAAFAITTAAEILEGAMSDRNWTAAVGASRRVAQARREHTELLQARGLLPRDLGLMWHYAEYEQIMRTVHEVLARHDIALEVREDLQRTTDALFGHKSDPHQSRDGDPGAA
jgi:hypothetical protein